MPAIWVPWPFASVSPSPEPVKTFVPATTFPARSGCEASTPVSSTSGPGGGVLVVGVAALVVCPLVVGAVVVVAGPLLVVGAVVVVAGPLVIGASVVVAGPLVVGALSVEVAPDVATVDVGV